MAKSNMIFGIHPLLEALEAGREIDKVMMRRGLRTEESARILALSRERSVPVQFVPEERLGRLTQRQHQGVIAFISEIEYTPLEELVARVYEEGRAPFIVLLDGLTDVRNFGAIARTAECAGVDALVIPERGSVSVTADAVKTSAGALHRIPVCRVSSIAAAVGLLHSSRWGSSWALRTMGYRPMCSAWPIASPASHRSVPSVRSTSPSPPVS